MDAVNKTITVTVGARGAKEDRTYKVAKEAKIIVNGKDGTLADLPEGSVIGLVVAEGNTVIQIRIAVRKDRKQND